MNVTLYTFSKKHNSTAVPTGGTSVDVVLKDEAGVLDPIIELHTSASPSAYNYLYIPTFGRYYWLREWTYNRGIWTGSFYVDPLASWKTQIGAQQLYVFRAAAEWDGRVVDRFYPTIGDVEYQITSIPKVWTPDAASDFAAKNTGLYVVGIYSGNGGQPHYLGFDETNLGYLLSGLFNTAYYETVCGTTSLTPEIKASIDPLAYISSIKFFPCAFNTSQGMWGYLHYSGTVTDPGMVVGKGTVARPITYYTFNDPMSEMNKVFQINGDTSFDHPQISRGVFMRAAPYTVWELYMPPFGVVTLDSADLMEADLLYIRMTTDIRTGGTSLDIYVRPVGQTLSSHIVHLEAEVGIDIPVARIIQTGTNYLNIAGDLLGAGLSLIGGNIGGVFSAAHNMIGEFSKGQIPHTSSIGNQGSANSLCGYPNMVTRFTKVTDDDLAGRGRPLCAKRTISTIPGYITADPDEVSIAASARELEEIRGFISGGFFYE